ncbi:MAG: rhomboid family intramembrane serine protease [Erysipelotrichales bacterium]|nr:MAG: rhomboid family intramembrane serine protease [Erysipelotrichales bacterium]
MAILNQDVWALRLAKILIERYAYDIIDVRTEAREIWLGNPNRQDYPLLRLTGENFFRKPIDSQRVQRIRDAIETFFKRKMDLTEIEFSTDGEGTLEDNIIRVSPDRCTDPKIIETFPEIKEVVLFAEDPQSEYKKLAESIRAVRDKQVKETRRKFERGIPWASFIIIGICIIMTVVVNLMATQNDIFASAILLGAYYKTFVLAGNEYWRLFTGGFIHIDIFHLMVNMMALINIGIMLERLYGKKRYLIILFSGIVIGNAFVFIGQGNVLTVGISGGLYALLGSLAIYAYDNGWLKQPQFRNQLLFIFSINLLINFMPNISVLGHMGGLLAGLLLGIIFSETPHLKALRTNAKFAAIAMLIAMVPLSQMNVRHDPIYGITDGYVLDIATKYGLGDYAKSMGNNLSVYYESLSK